jgi:surface polysaccharide O-acyltransferase-like enzyme
MILLIIQQAFYPAILSYDGQVQWNQVQSGKIDNAHPFLTTYVMHLLAKIWNSPGVVVVFHTLVFSTIWGLICLYVNKKNYKKNYIFLSIMCLFPIVYLYVLTIWKDVLYSYILLFISFLILKGVDKKYNYNIKEILLLGVSLVLTVLYRHNGILVSFLLLLLLLFKFIKNKINIKKIIVLILTIVASYSMLNIPKKLYLYEGPSEMVGSGLSTFDSYAVFILSTFYNNNAIKDTKDLEIIYSIADKEIWTTYYDPYLINTLLFREEINTKYILNHKKEVYDLLIKYCIKKPQYLVKHYLLADSMLYNPIPLGALYVFEFAEWNPNYGFYGNTKTHIPWLRHILTYETRITYGYPYILRVLMYRPIYPLALSVIMLLLLYKEKKIKKEHFMILAPMLCNTISLLPINLAQDARYVYINFLTFFFVLFLFINKKEFKKKEIEKEKRSRNLNIDLIKTLACLFVIGVHSLLRNDFYIMNIDNNEQCIFTTLRSLFINCVPLFIITTGYLMCNKKLNKNYYKGILKTLILTIIIGIITILIFDKMTISKFINNMINFSGANYAWYVRLYFGLFLLIPFLNIIINNIKNKKHLFVLIVSIALLTSVPNILLKNNISIINTWWSQIYPLMYYFVGAFIRKYPPKISKIKSLILFIVFLLLNGFINIYITKKGTFIDGGLNNYSSTLVLFTSLYLFIYVLKVDLEKVPNIFKWLLEKISQNTLSIYLISYIFDRTIYDFIRPFIENRILFSSICILGVFICSFICALILDKIYDKFINKPVNKLYDLGANIINKILNLKILNLNTY